MRISSIDTTMKEHETKSDKITYYKFMKGKGGGCKSPPPLGCSVPSIRSSIFKVIFGPKMSIFDRKTSFCQTGFLEKSF